MSWYKLPSHLQSCYLANESLALVNAAWCTQRFQEAHPCWFMSLTCLWILLSLFKQLSHPPVNLCKKIHPNTLTMISAGQYSKQNDYLQLISKALIWYCFLGCLISYSLVCSVCLKPCEQGRQLKRIHWVSNIGTALKFLEGRKVSIQS